MDSKIKEFGDDYPLIRLGKSDKNDVVIAEKTIQEYF